MKLHDHLKTWRRERRLARECKRAGFAPPLASYPSRSAHAESRAATGSGWRLGWHN